MWCVFRFFTWLIVALIAANSFIDVYNVLPLLFIESENAQNNRKFVFRETRYIDCGSLIDVWFFSTYHFWLMRWGIVPQKTCRELPENLSGGRFDCE